DQYTFTLGGASRLYFDSLTNSTSLTWTLAGPTGAVVSNRTLGASDGFVLTSPLLSLAAGDYTLTVDGTGDATGAYSFRLSDLAAAAVLTPGTAVSGTLSPANETDVYRFDAAAGDHFHFNMQARTGAGNPLWRLLDPLGAETFNTPFTNVTTSDVDTLTLGQTGTYTLLVEGA